MSRPRRICIVTCDIVGPIRNGGIGTAYASLAHALELSKLDEADYLPGWCAPRPRNPTIRSKTRGADAPSGPPKASDAN